MPWQPLPFVGETYADDSRPWSSQECVNYILTRAERPGARSADKLVGAPGLKAYSEGMQQAPVRGLHDVEGLLLAVAGNMLYQIRPSRVAVPIGVIPGSSRVSMAHNQITNGYEVMIANGQSGYVYNTATGAFGQVTDDGFPGLTSAAYIDGYIAGIEPQGRFWAHSELRQATEWNTLDRYDAEAAPDKMVALVVASREVVVLSQRTGQIFRNTGAVTGTFQNANGMEFQIGCASKHGAVVIDNGVCFLGSDGLVYMLRGGAPTIVSTGPIASAMRQHDLSTCFAMVFEDNKHKIAYFTFPTGQTFGFDFWTNAWHRRKSYGLDRWRVSALVKSNGRWIAGDYANGRLYELDWDCQIEYDQPLVRSRVSGAINADGNAVVVNALKFLLDTGRPTVGAGEFPIQPTGPTIEGAAPDGVVGFAYAGYQYTITEGDAAISTVTITSGALPGGVEMDNAGLIDTGTLTAPGAFTFTVRATDTNGLWAEVTDTVEITNVVLLLFETEMAGEGSQVYATGDIDNFGSPTPFLPVLVSSNYVLPAGAAVAGTHFIASLADNTLIQGDLPPYGANCAISTTGAALNQDFLTVIDGIAFAWARAAGATYQVSEDEGATWSTVAAPGGLNFRGIARQPNGRWHCVTQAGSSRNGYFSDEDVPSTWTPSTSGVDNPASFWCIAAGENYVYMYLTSARIGRSTDGVNWEVSFSTGAGALPATSSLFVTSTGAVIAYGADSSYQSIAISRDDGETFNYKTLTGLANVANMFEVEGRLYASGATGVSGASLQMIHYSDDDGETWTPVSVPWASTGVNACLVPYVVEASE